MSIHPTAVVDPGAKIPSSCAIGPYCIVGPNVELGENCELVSHVVLEGPTRLGNNNKIYPFSAVGIGPQDLSYRDEPTRLEKGDRGARRRSTAPDPGDPYFERPPGREGFVHQLPVDRPQLHFDPPKAAPT